MASWIVGGLIVLAAGAALWKMIRDRRAGRHSCGGDCSRCRGCH